VRTTDHCAGRHPVPRSLGQLVPDAGIEPDGGSSRKEAHWVARAGPAPARDGAARPRCTCRQDGPRARPTEVRPAICVMVRSAGRRDRPPEPGVMSRLWRPVSVRSTTGPGRPPPMPAGPPVRPARRRSRRRAPFRYVVAPPSSACDGGTTSRAVWSEEAEHLARATRRSSLVTAFDAPG